MHHVLAAIDDVEVELGLLFFQQFGAFTGVGAVFAAKHHQQRHLQVGEPLP